VGGLSSPAALPLSWVSDNIPANDDADRHTRGANGRLFVFLISLVLMGVGALAAVDCLWGVPGISRELPVSGRCAAAFFLCGNAMLTAQRYATASRALALASLMLCLHAYFDRSPGVATHNYASFGSALELGGAWAAYMAVMSIAVVCSRLGPVSRRLARVAGVGLIIAAIAFRIDPVSYGLDPYVVADTANLALLLGILAGGGIIALSRRRQSGSVVKDKSIAVIGVLGVLVSVLGWYALTGQERHTTRIHAQGVSERIVGAIAKSVQGQLSLIDRMSARWNAHDTLPSHDMIATEFGSYLRDVDAFHLLGVIDDAFRVHAYQSRDAASLAMLEERLKQTSYRQWVHHVQASGQPHFSAVDVAYPTALQSMIAAPVTGPGLSGWTLIAVQDIQALLTEAIGHIPKRLRFQIEHNGRLLFAATTDNDVRMTRITSVAVPLHHNMTWEVSAWHVEPLLPDFPRLLPDIVLLIGLTFTFCLIRTKRLAGALRMRSVQLQYGLLHDPMTALPNKRHLNKRLSDACEAACSDGFSVWVVLFKLDGIKLINDSMGHFYGDRILMDVARRIQLEVHNDGAVARLEGDEFVVVFTAVARGNVIETTRCILTAIARPYWIENMELCVSASAGITVSDGRLVEPMELVQEAGLAMARAKQEGPNAWYEYTSDLGATVAERLALRNEIQKALDEDGFELHYQPLIKGDTGRIIGVEALLRWRHAAQGEIRPSVFVPLAEESGQIVPLSNWVLDTACRHLAVLRAHGLSGISIAVNVSPLFFQRADFVSLITNKLLAFGLAPCSLEIEITEGVLLDTAMHTITKLRQLRELGVSVSIDDFGTGYSSLSYLKNLPIDKIKIDRSFIAEVTTDRHNAAITRAITALAHHLNLIVVAEGVETESQFWFLNQNACDEYQGYLFDRPMTFDALLHKLRRNGLHVGLPFLGEKVEAKPAGQQQ
jgi:diguanylate cyclase (GGDEF)-like protein